jgi:hypothetical protein
MLYLRGEQGNCNICTMTGFRSHFAVKRMDAQGFVSKNARLEKVHRKKHAPWLIDKGIIVWVTTKLTRREAAEGSERPRKSQRNLTCSSLYWQAIPIIPGQGHDLGKFLSDLLGALQENIQNNIRSTRGTPLDSGRLRQALH